MRQGLVALVAALVSTGPLAPAARVPTTIAGPAFAQIAADFQSLVKAPSAATVQGFDPALAQALKVSSSQERSECPGLLGGSVRVFSARRLSSNVATVDFGLTVDGCTSRFVGTAVPVNGTWRVSWVTVCMLVEDQGTVCPPAPHGVIATVPLPYSLNARRQLASEPPGLVRPEDMGDGPHGSLLITDVDRDQILQWWPDGRLGVFAGTGQPGFSGDGGPARQARLDLAYEPTVALAPNGSVYIADSGNNRLRIVSPNGTISTVGRYPGISGVAVSASGVVYIATGSAVERLSRTGKATVIACASFRSSSCPPGHSQGLPKGTGFSPSLIAPEGDGAFVVWSDGPRDLFRMTPSGELTDLGPDYIDAMAPAPDGSVLLAEHGTAVGRVVGTHVEHSYISLDKANLAGYATGVCGSFQPDGIAAGRNGTVYVDTFIGNGWTCDNGLVQVGANGKGHELRITTPVLASLPSATNTGFPSNIYPLPRPASGHDLPACPSRQGIEPFTAVVAKKALAVASRFNAFVSSFYGDLRSTDRAWWPNVFSDWVSNYYDNDTHTIVSSGPASKDLFAAAVAHACGEQLVEDSMVVVVGPSAYSSQVSHLYFLDRDGQPLIYFQDQ